jgi:hypothetical protein
MASSNIEMSIADVSIRYIGPMKARRGMRFRPRRLGLRLLRPGGAEPIPFDRQDGARQRRGRITHVTAGFRPESLRGASGSGQVAGHVDYRLARNAIVSEYRKGRLSRLDVCDAHPELLRAATNVGEESREECPICEEAKVRLVSYVFGSRLPPSGKCVTTRSELAKLSRGARDLACYVVEVCPNCSGR